MVTNFQIPPVMLTLQIDSSIPCISPLGEAIHSLCLYATDSTECASQMQLAVIEAINNIVLHAYHNRKGNPITVKWNNENRQLRIEITDFGDSMTAPPIPELAPWDAENGRGWWIINACVDEYDYKVVFCDPQNAGPETGKPVTSPEKANILTLIKHY